MNKLNYIASWILLIGVLIFALFAISIIIIATVADIHTLNVIGNTLVPIPLLILTIGGILKLICNWDIIKPNINP